MHFLEARRFEIEHKAFPKRPRNETDESEELIVLVGKKLRWSLDGDPQSVKGQAPEAQQTFLVRRDLPGVGHHLGFS